MTPQRPLISNYSIFSCVLLVGGAAGLWGSVLPVAHAQYGARAQIQAPLASESELDPTVAASTATRVESRQALDSTEALISRLPGARVQRSGTTGSASFLSIRGAGAEHTTVVFDDLLLSRADGLPLDLNTIPLSLLESVQVYRGADPSMLGAGAVGGVLRLVPRQARERRAGVGFGVGSFGELRAQAYSSVVSNQGLSISTALGLHRTAGDFLYADNGGTPFDASDDRDRPRRNAQTEQGHTMVHLRAPVGRGRLSALLMGFGQRGGVPGPAVQPTAHARRQFARGLATASYTQEGDSGIEGQLWRWRVQGLFGHSRNRLSDRFGEIGLGAQVTNDGAYQTQLQTTAELPLLPYMQLSGLLRWQWQHFDPHDALAASPNAASTRNLGTANIETLFHSRLGQLRWQLRPSVGIQFSDTRLSDIRIGSQDAPRDDTRALTNAKLAGALELLQGLTLSSSVARGARLPNMGELFGDRGYLIGNTNLLPERSWSVDAGLVWKRSCESCSLLASLRGFAWWVDDLIRYTQTSLYTAVPENLGQGRVQGIEASIDHTIAKLVHWNAALTRMWTRADQGRTLPLKPEWQVYMRVEVTPFTGETFEPLIYAELDYLSENFSDAANLVTLPARARFNTGTQIWLLNKQLELRAALLNLGNTRNVDLLGFPLPGRAFSLEVRVHMPL